MTRTCVAKNDKNVKFGLHQNDVIFQSPNAPKPIFDRDTPTALSPVPIVDWEEGRPPCTPSKSPAPRSWRRLRPSNKNSRLCRCSLVRVWLSFETLFEIPERKVKNTTTNASSPDDKCFVRPFPSYVCRSVRPPHTHMKLNITGAALY